MGRQTRAGHALGVRLVRAARIEGQADQGARSGRLVRALVRLVGLVRT